MNRAESEWAVPKDDQLTTMWILLAECCYSIQSELRGGAKTVTSQIRKSFLGLCTDQLT